MNVRSALMILVVLAYAGFEVNGLRMSQHLFEPLFIFDQFSSMQQAELQCGRSGAAVRERFDLNYAAVRTKAIRELAATHPKSTRDDLERMLDTRDRARRAEVDRLIDSAGCRDREVWELTKLYEQRARLTIRTRS